MKEYSMSPDIQLLILISNILPKYAKLTRRSPIIKASIALG